MASPDKTPLCTTGDETGERCTDLVCPVHGIPTSKPRLLDLFCGAGGAAVGYARAGFEVVGVDHVAQPNYPFKFFQDDALLFMGDHYDDFPPFDAIHASPPCQAHSTIGKQSRSRDASLEHPDLIAATRDVLRATGLPYVIENVPGSPLVDAVTLCGSSVGLDVRRHRLFETNWPLMVPSCVHGVQPARFGVPDKRRESLSAAVPVFGTGRQVWSKDGETLTMQEQRDLQNAAMGVDWMSPYELSQAIPPAYTELIGHQLMQSIKQQEVAA